MIDMTKISTKFQIASIVIPVVLLVLLVLVPNLQYSLGITESNLERSTSSGSVTSQSDCASSVDKQTQTALKSIDVSSVKLLATQNLNFQSKIKGYESTFNSIFIEGSFDPECTVSWKDVNVVYDLKDSKGQYLRHIIVHEDPSLNTVLGVSEQVGTRFADFAPTSNWSGYQFWYRPNSTSFYPVWETTSSWQVPTVYNPTNSTYNPACNSSNGKPWCDTSVWNGLQDSLSGSDNMLAQGGSNSNMTCTSGTCTKYNLIWYEFLGNMTNGVYCPSIPVYAGDNISTDIIDSSRNSSATSSQYVISVQDTTTTPGGVCGAVSYNYAMNNPKYADYIIERNTHNNMMSTLANFSSTTMSGTIYYNNSYNSIQASVNAGYYGRILMEN